ncbi:Hypothetical predicted protein [Mytilus galloprovincialis]|uniref:Uncharacterized protein n=1 Tax=Mytilus galloprovincialis TaxID=29158 RepID=A0A8B6G4P9_MYTGA|nr:Hypothetical predicted protein [Mytilus galloprovincialis]
MLSCSTDLQKENIQLAINSAEWNGFHHKCGSSFIRYHRSSQGKDFKAFVQLAPFVVKRAGYEQEVVQLWCMLAEIIELINRRQLKESELAHLEDIQIMFNQKVFDRFPETKRKQKMHHNLHTEDNIRMHGVPVEYTTEAGESWCGIVKNCQYITNHHNPNRDTAYKLTHVEYHMDNGTWKVNGKRVNPARQTVQEICHSRIQSFVFGNQTENNDVTSESVGYSVDTDWTVFSSAVFVVNRMTPVQPDKDRRISLLTVRDMSKLEARCPSQFLLCSYIKFFMPRSHIHGSPRRIHYGSNLTDDPGNAVSVVRYGCATV